MQQGRKSSQSRSSQGKPRTESSGDSIQCCKLFIGGLSYDTTDASLQRYFEEYGEVESAVVLRDPTTLRSRGFGFVTFVNYQSAREVVAFTRHLIDGRKVEAKYAVPRASTAGNGSSNGGSSPATAAPQSPSSPTQVPVNQAAHVSGVPTAASIVAGTASAGAANVSNSNISTKQNLGGVKGGTKGKATSPSPVSSLRSSSATSFSSASTAASLPYSAAVTGGISNNAQGTQGTSRSPINFAAVAGGRIPPTTVEETHAEGVGSLKDTPVVVDDDSSSSRKNSMDTRYHNYASGSFDSTGSFDGRKSSYGVATSSTPKGNPKKTDSKRKGSASSNNQGTSSSGGGIISNKIFVGGLLYATGHESLRNFFEVYGPVDTAEVIYNRDTKKSRGFGFVVFRDHESVTKVLEEQDEDMHCIDGKQVEVKRCVARQEGSSKSGDMVGTSAGMKSNSKQKVRRQQSHTIEEEKEAVSGTDVQHQQTVTNQWTKKPTIISFAAAAAAGTTNDAAAAKPTPIDENMSSGSPVLDASRMTTAPSSGSESNMHGSDSPEHRSYQTVSPQLGSVDHQGITQTFEMDEQQQQAKQLAVDVDTFQQQRVPRQDDYYLENPFSAAGGDEYYEDDVNFRNERTASSSSSSSFLNSFVSPVSPAGMDQGMDSAFHQSAFSPRNTHDDHAAPFISLSSPGPMANRGSPLPHIHLDNFQNVIGSPTSSSAVRTGSPGPLGDGAGIWGSSALGSPSHREERVRSRSTTFSRQFSSNSHLNGMSDIDVSSSLSSFQLEGQTSSAPQQLGIGESFGSLSLGGHMGEHQSPMNSPANSPVPMHHGYSQQQRRVHHHHQQPMGQNLRSPIDQNVGSQAPNQFDTSQEYGMFSMNFGAASRPTSNSSSSYYGQDA
mmetsp:Transcript_8210/g.13264  ORF Transcript_8210/g.13264 Transcript_8210/m.13264 type:complete len:891 (-) Transcript_8210:90-2762(-)|eukprot:CAMPEP_0203744542 /NCGR_PEP_ID=MMETSP0098-20131031/570_1 /ASSEMBLY_ACC=CAM_ASM_000208 /TAXON_ID=96639 /ORGANISM=" , Strain NY0313808BC1" /LENGTH=890 /DNA_ID=CAMNT_0050632081 /DNA_START=478 /DNA_END=3150 /DNA_ORIENTATION=-